jgi:hypothetical protein
VEYRIEKLSEQNIQHLVPLYRAAFHQSVLPSYLLKKYNTRSLGVEFIGFIAFTPKAVAAAYYGVIPCLFQLKGKTVVAAQSADTMTHPEHRQKGLFQLLAQQTYDLAREQNIQFIFGFPNQHSLPGLVKLKWQFLADQLQMFKISVGGLAYARILKKSDLMSLLYNTLLSRFLGNERPAESFFEKRTADGVRHDRTFFAYKTYNATHIVKISNAKIWIKADGKLKVGAVQGLYKNNAVDFLRRIKKLASRLGCSELIFMTCKHSALYQVLSETLTPKDAFPIGFLPLQEEPLVVEHISFEYCDVDIF